LFPAGSNAAVYRVAISGLEPDSDVDSFMIAALADDNELEMECSGLKVISQS
jgi:hypothetical protein